MTRLRVRLLLTLLLTTGASAVATLLWLGGSGSAWALPLAALGATLLAFVVLERIWLRPLEGVEHFARTVARGETGPRLPLADDSPVAELSGSIARIVDELRRRSLEASSDKERLEAVLGAMVEGVLVVAPDGRVVLANPRFREIFSVWGRLAGRVPMEVVRNATLEDALRAAAGTRDVVVREITLGSGDPHHVLLHAVGFPREGSREGTVVVFHDVTELRRLEGVRREFVANVSHELRTPLTAIRGYAETLAAGDASAGDTKSFAAVIVRHARRLEQLIEDVLQLSRIESRKLPLQLDEVDVSHLAETVVLGMRPQLEARSLQVEVQAGTRVRAWADRRAVEQILTNLIDNASKYTDPGGAVTVRVEEVAGAVRLSVSDTGIGIPEHARSRIFERFYRVDQARSRDLGGTGLGLSIVKHLVQSLRGEIFVESEPGRGTTFRVRLPAGPPRPEAVD